MTRSPPPMDLFTDAFRWHDRYLPPLAQPEGLLLLLSETELLGLGSPGVLAVERVLRAGVSLDSHCRAEGPPALLAEMLHALEALVRQGLVRPVRGDEAARYVVPDFSSPVARVRSSGHADVVLLSKAVSDKTALRSAHELAGSDALTIVFCDDYLDPRLGQIDAQQRAAKQPWLLVKPSGEQAMAGPLFTPEALSACWHCLAHRLLRNRPARAWWQARHGGVTVGVPVRAGHELIEARLRALRPLAQGLVARRGQQLWTLDPPQAHAVVARPQCPHCGDAGLMARLQREPVALAPCLSGARPDGGWRTMPASATVERLAPHVDALCGVIARVVPLGAEVEDALTVYRSEIFKMPAVHSVPSTNALVQVCLGKGMSTGQSRASAMCEAIERYAAFYQGDEACVIAAASALDARCIRAHELARFSERQCEQGKMPPHAAAPQAGPSSDVAWWAPAWSLTSNARCYLPLSFCYANAPAESQRHALWTSNGCAAGNTREEAILQGLLELVERDAAAIWWYGRIQRPAVDLGILSAESLKRIERGLGPSWHRWVLDITHDFGIPVVAAIGRHRTTGDWAIGFGCSPDLVLACERALTEMGQLIAAEKKFVIPQSDHANGVPRFLMPGEAAPVPPAAGAARADIAQEIARCVGIAAILGMETVVLDHTRPDIPLRTVKVVVPGLCHIWPELGNPRLYRVPVAMGWRSAPLQERDLNPQPLYV